MSASSGGSLRPTRRGRDETPDAPQALDVDVYAALDALTLARVLEMAAGHLGAS